MARCCFSTASCSLVLPLLLLRQLLPALLCATFMHTPCWPRLPVLRARHLRYRSSSVMLLLLRLLLLLLLMMMIMDLLRWWWR